MRQLADAAPPAARVLVADDDADLRELVCLAVRRAGASVVSTVADGAAALAGVRSERPDLAVLDVSMPGLSGLEVCRTVRGEPATAAVHLLLLSAWAAPDDVARGLAAGADVYLAKPFALPALVTSVRELTGGRP